MNKGTILDAKTLKEIFAGRRKHKAYSETVKIAKKLTRHAHGEGYGDLIEKRRPSESEEIKQYRNDIMVEITYGTISKIYNCLGKIRKSPDWNIKYDESAVPARINKKETLEKYLDKKFPTFKSITNWAFQVLLEQYGNDPNSVCLVNPLKYKIAATEYLRPYPLLFSSEAVYDFVEDDYAVLLSTDKSKYTIGNSPVIYEGNVFYFVNTQSIMRYEQRSQDPEMLTMVEEYKHNLGELPAFKVKGLVKKTLDKTVLYRSRLSAIVPHLDEVVREYSDLQAEVVQHIHSTFWYHGGQKCNTCGGRGSVAGLKGPTKCEACKGEGSVPLSQFQSIRVQPAAVGQQAAATPPAGYIQKQTEIVKIQDERIDKHQYRALAAVNMEFLAQTPLSQSGEAKKTDREELTTFVNSVAEDIVGIMDLVAYYTCEMRYQLVVPSPDDREKMLPNIHVPDRFDLFSADFLLQEYKTARESKVGSPILTALEVDYAGKKFNTDSNVRDIVQAVLMLDPMPNKTDDEKQAMLQNKGVREIDYIISCNIHPFVIRAVEESPDFLKKKLSEKKKILAKYAGEVMTANSPEGKVLAGMDPDGTVQDTALNGAQMAQLLQYAQAVKDGLPKATGIALAVISFPNVKKELIDAVFNPIEESEPNPDPNPKPGPTPPLPPPPPNE